MSYDVFLIASRLLGSLALGEGLQFDFTLKK